MKIAVIDGQGGGVGRSLVTGLKEQFGTALEIIALGTNALATSSMMKAGADAGATGENAIIFNVGKVNLVTGPFGIIMANSMLGEVTPAVARAVGESSCKKILIPIQKCNIEIAGIESMPMQSLIDDAVKRIGRLINP